MNKWLQIKIVVKNTQARLYLNGAGKPALVVNDLKLGGDVRGNIGLWIGPGTIAHFTELNITENP